MGRAASGRRLSLDPDLLSVLRRHLASERDRARQLVVTEAGAYRFATHQVDLDLDRFDELLERSAGEPTRSARRSLATALALVRGEVLEDEPYAGWAHDLRGSYQGRVLGAHLDAADHALAELDFADALAHSDAAATLDRFSERAQRTGMLALYALGRQHDALARYRCYRAALDQELGLEPTGETRALEVSILRQDDALSLLPRPIERAELPNPRFVAKALANGHPRAASTTLTEALVAQCRAEGPWGYRVLCAASLLEQPFEPDPVADLLGADAAELVEELERLCERRILRVDGLRFRFRYELVRQVLLGSISPARRRLLQRRLELSDGLDVPGDRMTGSAAG